MGHSGRRRTVPRPAPAPGLSQVGAPQALLGRSNTKCWAHRALWRRGPACWKATAGAQGERQGPPHLPGSELDAQLPAVCRGHCKPAKSPRGGGEVSPSREGREKKSRGYPSLPFLPWNPVNVNRVLSFSWIVYCRGIVLCFYTCSKNPTVLSRILRSPILIIFF